MRTAPGRPVPWRADVPGVRSRPTRRRAAAQRPRGGRAIRRGRRTALSRAAGTVEHGADGQQRHQADGEQRQCPRAAAHAPVGLLDGDPRMRGRAGIGFRRIVADVRPSGRFGAPAPNLAGRPRLMAAGRIPAAQRRLHQRVVEQQVGGRTPRGGCVGVHTRSADAASVACGTSASGRCRERHRIPGRQRIWQRADRHDPRRGAAAGRPVRCSNAHGPRPEHASERLPEVHAATAKRRCRRRVEVVQRDAELRRGWPSEHEPSPRRAPDSPRSTPTPCVRGVTTARITASRRPNRYVLRRNGRSRCSRGWFPARGRRSLAESPGVSGATSNASPGTPSCPSAATRPQSRTPGCLRTPQPVRRAALPAPPPSRPARG